MMNKIRDFLASTGDMNSMPSAKNSIRTDGDFWLGAYPFFVENDR